MHTASPGLPLATYLDNTLPSQAIYVEMSLNARLPLTVAIGALRPSRQTITIPIHSTPRVVFCSHVVQVAKRVGTGWNRQHRQQAKLLKLPGLPRPDEGLGRASHIYKPLLSARDLMILEATGFPDGMLGGMECILPPREAL